jgi:hypothetical protein
MMARILSNISGEATSRFGNIFNEAMRHCFVAARLMKRYANWQCNTRSGERGYKLIL